MLRSAGGSAGGNKAVVGEKCLKWARKSFWFWRQHREPRGGAGVGSRWKHSPAGECRRDERAHAGFVVPNL